MNRQEISNYIFSQLQSGLTQADITGQLQAAGWSDEDIQSGFKAARGELKPTTPAQPQQPTAAVGAQPSPANPQPATSPQQLPPPINRGRMKTGWLLFKQSFSVIKKNPELWRYMIVSMIWNLLLCIILIVFIIYDVENGSILFVENGEEIYPTLPGIVLLIVSSIVLTTITYYYATGLSAHVLNIFRAQQTSYKQSMSLARGKLPAIITFSIITVIVGYILQLLEERFKFIGWIVSKFLGLLWALATAFVIPIIADSNSNGGKAVKESVILFKENWGETATSRITLGGLVYLVYFLVMVPLTIFLSIVMTTAFGPIAILAVLALFFIGAIILFTVEALATNILNVALYYYAKHKVIPPAFSPELLASVFVDKKKK